MKLFDLIPANFFSLLVSSNREIYVDALMILHDEFKDKLNILVEDYLSSLIFLLEDRSFEAEDGDEAESGSLTVSGKARLILNRLVKTGWVEKEFIENSFIEIITPCRYAIPVMKLLSELGSSQLEEYNSMVFATFSGLKQARDGDRERMYEAVLSARANTEQLQYSLRSLYHGIRGFLRGIVLQQNVNLLLEDHFVQFKQLSDRFYHPIKTMDSVYRYMGPIQSLLSGITGDEDLLSSMFQRAMTIRKYTDEAEARTEILSAIDYIAGTYDTLDGLISEIDRKHSSYTKSSVEKIRYLMTADQTIKGKLGEILKAYAGGEDEDEAAQEKVLELMTKSIHAQRQEFFDSGSLYHKNVRSRRLSREALAVDANDPLSGLAQEFLLDQIKTSYPLPRIKAFVEGLLSEGRDRIEAVDIPLASDTDFILLILAVIRHQDAGMPYTIEAGEGRIFSQGYWIPNLTILRKETAHEVE